MTVRRTLETSLVEWKLNEIHSAPPGVPTLETSLVEWKQRKIVVIVSGRKNLGNFLSGMETVLELKLRDLDEPPWKLP